MSKSDSSDDIKYKSKICDRNKKHQKRKKQDSSDSFWATLIIPMKAIIKSRDTIKRISKTKETGSYQSMREINGKVTDESVQIEGLKIQIG